MSKGYVIFTEQIRNREAAPGFTVRRTSSHRAAT